MIKHLTFTLAMLAGSINIAFAQFVNCPSGLVKYTPFYSTNLNGSCGLQSGVPSCPRKGWIMNPFALTCSPPQQVSEPATCKDGEIIDSMRGCIKPYQEIQNGQPMPNIFNECMQNRWYEDRFSSPVALCSTAIQQAYGSEDIEKIRECVLSGRFSRVPANPQSYCQMRASEFWGNPENMNQQSVWIPR